MAPVGPESNILTRADKRDRDSLRLADQTGGSVCNGASIRRIVATREGEVSRC